MSERCLSCKGNRTPRGWTPRYCGSRMSSGSVRTTSISSDSTEGNKSRISDTGFWSALTGKYPLRHSIRRSFHRVPDSCPRGKHQMGVSSVSSVGRHRCSAAYNPAETVNISVSSGARKTVW
ncbi:hypothetical protein B0H12DRAFT_1143451 [Mycena haematopus]|nr:hypothetical protein B0H12DRAFT_1143451 [Mycena haematopus]